MCMTTTFLKALHISDHILVSIHLLITIMYTIKQIQRNLFVCCVVCALCVCRIVCIELCLCVVCALCMRVVYCVY